MSADATAWAWGDANHYTGGAFVVLLAIASVANDLHDNELWMTTGSLARKARVSRSTAVNALAQFVRDGVIECIERNKDKGKASRYRFLAGGVTGDRAGVTGDRAGGAQPPVTELKRTKEELNNKAGAKAPAEFDPEHPPCTDDVELLDAKTARGAVATEIARAFWDWVKHTTGHEPPENYNAIRAIIDKALAADFPVRRIKEGLATIQENRPRPITRQTLWDAMGKAQRPSKRSSGTNDWIEGVEALHAKIEADRRAAGEYDDIAPPGAPTKDTP